MGSYRKRQGKGPATQVETRIFVKTIEEEEIRNGKLEIPDVFRKCVAAADEIYLKVPNGDIYPMQVTMCKRQMWAERGWPEFAKIYSLEHGYTVVFNYEVKNLLFKVCLYDRTNMEINYDGPLSSSSDEEHNVSGGKNDCPTEKYGERLLTRKTEVLRRMQIDDEGNKDEDEDEGDEVGFEDEDDIDDDDSIEDLDDFPPCSKSVSKSTLASRLHRRKRSCGGTKEQSNIKYAAAGSSSTQRSFLQERPEITGHRKSIALQRANDFKSKYVNPCNPSFVVSLSHLSAHGCSVNVPPDFSHRHLNEKPCRASFRLNGEIWKLRFLYSKSDTRLHSSWKQFAEANHLEEGDACLFVLTNNINFVFDVVIFRTTKKVQIDPPQ